MATVLRPSHSYTDERTTIAYLTCGRRPSPGFGANAARRFERTCHVVARTIDVSLMWLFLVAAITQTVFLFSMVASQIIFS